MDGKGAFLKRYWPSIAIAVVGIACSVAGYLYSRSLEDDNIHNLFVSRAQEKGAAISLSVESKVLLLEAVHDLFVAKGTWSGRTFSTSWIRSYGTWRACVRWSGCRGSATKIAPHSRLRCGNPGTPILLSGN